MKRLILLALAAVAFLSAQEPAWQFSRELTGGGSGPATIPLDAETLIHIRDDGADIRLYDADGAEVPYVFRVLRNAQTAQSYNATEISRTPDEVVLDLGEIASPHNQVEVIVEGQDPNSTVEISGSNDAEQWANLGERVAIGRTPIPDSDTMLIRARYAPSPLRYLRVSAAAIASVQVGAAIIVPGQSLSTPVAFADRESVDGLPGASQYSIDLPGRMPLHAMSLAAPPEAFQREYRLLSFQGDKFTPVLVSAGTLTRQEGGVERLTVGFAEVFSRQLQLIVLDDGNPPLELSEPQVLTAVRLLLAAETPVRMVYGNPNAEAPSYDLENLQVNPSEIRTLTAGPVELNPSYEQPPAPLSERMPWLGYAVTGVVCLGLLEMLRRLVFDVETA